MYIPEINSPSTSSKLLPSNRLLQRYECPSVFVFGFTRHHLQAVRTNLHEALKVAAGSGSEEEKIEARIEADVYEALQHALGSK